MPINKSKDTNDKSPFSSADKANHLDPTSPMNVKRRGTSFVSGFKGRLQERINQVTMANCETRKQISLAVVCNFKSLSMMMIHPKNDTYPICTLKIDYLNVNYDCKFDHDELGFSMGNF